MKSLLLLLLGNLVFVMSLASPARKLASMMNQDLSERRKTRSACKADVEEPAPKKKRSSRQSGACVNSKSQDERVKRRKSKAVMPHSQKANTPEVNNNVENHSSTKPSRQVSQRRRSSNQKSYKEPSSEDLTNDSASATEDSDLEIRITKGKRKSIKSTEAKTVNKQVKKKTISSTASKSSVKKDKCKQPVQSTNRKVKDKQVAINDAHKPSTSNPSVSTKKQAENDGNESSSSDDCDEWEEVEGEDIRNYVCYLVFLDEDSKKIVH